ncbi:MAG: APC family permease [Clostridia bacterium]|nr:APC family permease [Clostridia bacterium]
MTNNPNNAQLSVTKTKYQGARANLLLMIILTAVNIVLLFTNAEYMLLFSATVPYFAVVVGMATQIDVMIAVSVCFAVAILLIYFLCWFMSKKHHGWMTGALVMFIIDTFAMILMYVSMGDFYGVLDVVIHVWVLYYLIIGVKSGKQLKDAPEEEQEPIEVKDYITYDELEAEGEVETNNVTIRNSQPICRAEEDVKHRVLLEADALGYHICYRRVKRMNQLVINGWVYAQVEMLVEPPHTLQAVIDGHLVEAGMDETPRSFIKVDGELITKKFRLI